jgi:hypothetical protein
MELAGEDGEPSVQEIIPSTARARAARGVDSLKVR